MDDLISRAAAIDALKRAAYWQDAERKITEIPAVDAVLVVRCRDCKHQWTGNPDLDCEICAGRDDWYCADGERMESDG